MRSWIGAIVVGRTVTIAAAFTQDAIPPELASMADTERAFAKAATVKGWRDAFLEFFADDAIAFAPQVMLAKDRLRKQPSTPFAVYELIWEPRTGDVAASGDLGWLTGPSTSINHKSVDKKPRYGCYLSVWRKQPDGAWRVFIDVGTDAPEPVPFAPGFNRMALTSRYTGTGTQAAARQSLADADRALNAQIAAAGVPQAFSPRLTPASRLHRSGTVPVIGREAIAAWLAPYATAGTALHGEANASAAGDFGYSHGTFELTTPKLSRGAYVRLWSRDADGRWWLVVDVAQNEK
jgi:ketosteroid isomerase-like protein